MSVGPKQWSYEQVWVARRGLNWVIGVEHDWVELVGSELGALTGYLGTLSDSDQAAHLQEASEARDKALMEVNRRWTTKEVSAALESLMSAKGASNFLDALVDTMRDTRGKEG